MATRRWYEHECRDVLLNVLGVGDAHHRVLLDQLGVGASVHDISGPATTEVLVQQLLRRSERTAQVGTLVLGPLAHAPHEAWPPRARLLAAFGPRYNAQAVVSADGAQSLVVWCMPADAVTVPATSNQS